MMMSLTVMPVSRRFRWEDFQGGENEVCRLNRFLRTGFDRTSPDFSSHVLVGADDAFADGGLSVRHLDLRDSGSGRRRCGYRPGNAALCPERLIIQQRQVCFSFRPGHVGTLRLQAYASTNASEWLLSITG